MMLVVKEVMDVIVNEVMSFLVNKFVVGEMLSVVMYVLVSSLRAATTFLISIKALAAGWSVENFGNVMVEMLVMLLIWDYWM